MRKRPGKGARGCTKDGSRESWRMAPAQGGSILGSAESVAGHAAP